MGDEKDVINVFPEDFSVPSEEEIKENEEFAKNLQEVYGVEEGEPEYWIKIWKRPLKKFNLAIKELNLRKNKSLS